MQFHLYQYFYSKLLKILTINYYVSVCTKPNSKWSKDLNVRSVILKLLEKSLGKALHDINTGSYFLDVTSNVQDILTNIDKTK